MTVPGSWDAWPPPELAVLVFIVCICFSTTSPLEYKLLEGKNQSVLFTTLSPVPRTVSGMQQQLIKYLINELIMNIFEYSSLAHA